MAESRITPLSEGYGRLLECAICLHDVVNHRLLPCQHMFCQTCLEPLVENRSVNCPVCRKTCQLESDDVSSLPRNLFLLGILDKICEKCKRENREIQCEHCNKWVCHPCHEKCKLDLVNQKKQVQDEIFDLLASERTSLKEVQSATLKVYKDVIQSARDSQIHEMAANKLRLGQLTEEMTTLKIREKEIRDEMESLEKRQKLLQQMLDEETDAQPGIAKNEGQRLHEHAHSKQSPELERLNKLYKDIDIRMNEMEGVLRTIASHPQDSQQLQDLRQQYENWKTDAEQSKKKNLDGRLSTTNTATLESTSTITNPSPVDGTRPKTRVRVADAAATSKDESKVKMIDDTASQPVDYLSKTSSYHLVGDKGSGAGQFITPTSIATSMISGEIVVCDMGNEWIRILDERFHFILAFGSHGTADGQFKLKSVNNSYGYPVMGSTTYSAPGVCFTPNDNIVVADTYNNRIQLFTKRGKHIRSVASFVVNESRFTGLGPARARPSTSLRLPTAVACDSGGNIYINDFANRRIVVTNENGDLNKIFGTTAIMGSWMPGQIAFCPNGDIAVVDYDEFRSDKLTNGKIEIFAPDGQHKVSLSVHGNKHCKLRCPFGLAVDKEGNFIVSDILTNLVHVLRPNGKLLCTYDRLGDRFSCPVAVDLTRDGNIVVAENGGHRLQIL